MAVQLSTPLLLHGARCCRPISMFAAIDALRSTPRTIRSPGTWASPASRISAGESAARFLALQPGRAMACRPQARKHLRQFRLPVAGHAGDPHDLAGTDSEADIAQRRQPAVVARPQFLDFEDHVALRRRARPAVEADLSADHHAHQLVLAEFGRRARRHLLAVAQHRHRVGDLHHLFQMVRNEDHRHALRHEAAQRLEQFAALLWRQHRGRLVEDDGARAAHQHLQDFDALLYADREQPDALGRIDLQPEPLATARACARSARRGRSAHGDGFPCRERRCRRPRAREPA